MKQAEKILSFLMPILLLVLIALKLLEVLDIGWLVVFIPLFLMIFSAVSISIFALLYHAKRSRSKELE